MSELAFVTGGTGFLGERLVKALLARGDGVRVLVPPRHEGGDRMLALGVEIASVELADREGLRESLRGCQTVYHLAGRLLRPGVPEAVYEAVHVAGTRSLLEACAAACDLRAVVHCSTTGVLGNTGAQPADETRPPRPSNVYERTKAQGEHIALDAAEQGLPVVVARPSLVYGPGDRHLLGWFRAIERGYYCVVGRGDNRLHPVYVDDVAAGLIRCADTAAARGRVYHLVGQQPVSIRHLAGRIAQALSRRLPALHLPRALAWTAASVLESLPGVSPARLPLTRQRVAFMGETRAYCGCRARRELGFEPSVGLDEGLARTVGWYRKEGLL
jgi:nucleoside-diphosphate-sugar epimerase